MANNENSDGIQTNDSINETNDSNNNVFNLEDLTKELLEIKSQLGKVNELVKRLQKELIKEKAKKGKERNKELTELMEKRFQELESILENEKLKIEDLPALEPLFEDFDAKFFKGILKKNNVKVKYSKRMFVHAGVCINEEDNRFYFLL
jgi:predicted nuclease with TOPRIM domain